MKKSKIVLYGHFGSGNVGNDSSLEAALYHIQSRLPSSEIICVCNGPELIASRYNITTLPIGASEMQQGNDDIVHKSNKVFSLISRIVIRITNELFFWFKKPAWFQSVDLFIVVGTGAVDDMAVRRPWHAPYELYKWCKCAKLGGTKVVFLSVGVGPIMNPLSRFLMLKALRLADYRSYRETAAFDYLRGVGFDTSRDLLYPDLVFSLNTESLNSSKPMTVPIKQVGLGVINYYGWKHDANTGAHIYQGYISKIKRFILWLFEKGYSIRLLVGDNIDKWVVEDIMTYVRQEAPSYQHNIFVEDISNVNDLFEQIVQTDIVVASRFHNVLCSLMLERPVISLGYHEKNDILMKEMGLDRYCQHIEQFTLEQLVDQFNSSVLESKQITHQIHNKLEVQRGLLREQYDRLLLPLMDR